MAARDAPLRGVRTVLGDDAQRDPSTLKGLARQCRLSEDLNAQRLISTVADTPIEALRLPMPLAVASSKVPEGGHRGKRCARS